MSVVWYNLQIPFATKAGHLIAPNFGLGFSIGKFSNEEINVLRIISIFSIPLIIFCMFCDVDLYCPSLE